VTDLAFHFNAPERVSYACRLLRKAVGSGAKVVVTGSSDTLQQLDAALWTFSLIDFVPHCRLESEPRLVAASPVILATSTESVPHRQVLLNLGSQVPNGFEKFERVIEIVTLDEEDRRLGRSRWKHYTDLGYTITRRDLTLKASQG
jgi:DNA polymerase III subunit chi